MEASKGISTEVIVVDNNSSDASIEYLTEKFPAVHFISNGENPGFGKACNQGLSLAKGKYVLFLNPDTLVSEDSFSECIKFAESQQNFGALGCRMIDGNGFFLPESKRLFPTAARTFFRMTGLSRLFPSNKIFSGYYAGHLDEKVVNEVDVLAGAFFLSKRKTLQDLQGFDEEFFMYGEDIDLSYRIQKQGLVNFYYPGVTIIHFKGESIQKFSKQHRRSFYGAMKLFVTKHYKNGIPSSILKTGITISSWFAIPGKHKIPNSNVIAAIAAGEKTFQDLVHYLKHSENPVILAGRVSILKEPNALCVIDDLSDCIKKEKFNTLVIACGDTSFKKAIEITTENKGRLFFLYNVPGSGALIGSNDKNSRGTVIVNH